MKIDVKKLMEAETLRGRIQWAATRLAEKKDAGSFLMSRLSEYAPRLTEKGVSVELSHRVGENQSPFAEISYKEIAVFLDNHDEAAEAAERKELVRLMEKFSEAGK
jgi:hypothetical protein